VLGVRATEVPFAGAASLAVLGPLAVVIDGQDIVLAGFRRRALLARLALGGGCVVAADRLAEDLWEDEPDRRSVPTLRTYVAKLRHLLPAGAAVVASRPGGYRLAIGADTLDAARFERALEAATGSPTDVERVLLPALAEWRGGAYEEFAHLGWARREALRLDELRLVAQERLFEAQLALGRQAEIVPALRALASAHPLRERLHIQLVTALYRSGRQADALVAQRRATATLVDTLGLDPSHDLADLEARILHQDASLAGPDGRPAPVRAHGLAGVLPRPLQRRGPDPAFVGRTAELAGLTAALAAGRADGARLVVIRGEPGIGKTRLAAEFADRARRAGATILYGRCDQDVGAPYQPFVAALRDLASRAPRDLLAAWLGDDAAALTAMVPDLADHLPARRPAGADPASQRLRLFDAVAGWLEALAGADATVIVLEDIHWATSSTLMLTRHVVRALADRPVLLLATARSTLPDASAELAALVADLRRDGRTEVIDLAGLDDDALCALISAERGTTSTPSDEIARLRAATAGNPFLLTGLARYGGPEAGGMPPTLRDVLLAWIERLPVPVRDALRVAAVTGLEFPMTSVAAVLGWDEEDAITMLDEAVAAGLLQEVDGATGRYGFVHGLVQVAVADGQGPTRRAATHAAVARALEAGDSRPDEIAHHWRGAGPDHAGAAAEWSARAGRQALVQHAYDEATQHLATALALDGGRDAAWRSVALLDLARAQVRMGDAAAAREAVVEAAALARATGDAVTLARAALEAAAGGRGVSGWVADAAQVDLLTQAREGAPPTRAGPAHPGDLRAVLGHAPGQGPGRAAAARAGGRLAGGGGRGAGGAGRRPTRQPGGVLAPAGYRGPAPPRRGRAGGRRRLGPRPGRGGRGQLAGGRRLRVGRPRRLRRRRGPHPGAGGRRRGRRDPVAGPGLGRGHGGDGRRPRRHRGPRRRGLGGLGCRPGARCRARLRRTALRGAAAPGPGGGGRRRGRRRGRSWALQPGHLRAPRPAARRGRPVRRRRRAGGRPRRVGPRPRTAGLAVVARRGHAG
jgi:DNA-binding SARP family transcriptional activator